MTASIYFTRIVLLVVFGVAPWAKVRSRASFRRFVAAVGEITDLRGTAGQAVATTVVTLELVTLGTLAALPKLGFFLALCLLVVFFTAVSRAVTAGKRTTCECFGSGGSNLGPSHVVRNGLLVIVAVVGTAGSTFAGTPGLMPTRSLVPAGVISLAIGVLVARWDDVAYVVTGRVS